MLKHKISLSIFTPSADLKKKKKKKNSAEKPFTPSYLELCYSSSMCVVK